MTNFRLKLIQNLFFKEDININTKEKYPKKLYTAKDYKIFFKESPTLNNIAFVSDNDDEIEMGRSLYVSPYDNINNTRDNLKAISFELSYSLSTQKKHKKFKNILDKMIKEESYIHKGKDAYLKELADGILYENNYSKDLQKELTTQMYALFSIDYEIDENSSKEVIEEANKIVREINDTLHLSSIIYPSPYDIYQIKGVFGFTEEKTASEDFHSLVEENLKANKEMNDEVISKITDDSIVPFSIENKEINKSIREPFQTEKIGAKKKFNQNIQALELIKQRKETYTPEDKRVLSKYTGFGGIPQAFYKVNNSTTKGWEKEAEKLYGILDTKEYAEARRSTLTSFFTPSEVVKEMYSQITPLFKNKKSIKVLEPSVGSGIFIQNMPQQIFKKSKIDAVELNTLTYDLFNAMQSGHDNIEAYNMSYLDFNAPNNSYDLIIGNPPFSNTKMHHNEENLYLHEHFIKKSMELLKDDGLMAMVVSNSFLDSKKDFREKLQESTGAELLSAIRLPSSAFGEEAHTEVVTDIVFLQKNPLSKEKDWIELGSVNKVPINKYFEKHQENLLGEWGLTGTMYQGERPNLLNKDFSWKEVFKNTSKISPNDAENTVITPLTNNNILFENAEIESRKSIEELARNTKIGSLFIHDDILYKRNEDFNTRMDYQKLHIPKSSKDNTVSETKLNQLKPFIKMKQTLLELSEKQLDENATDDELRNLRELLNKQYDTQIKKKNFINKSSIRTLIKYDSQYPLLLALEKTYVKGVGKEESDRTGKPIEKERATKSDIFFKRTQYPKAKIEKLNSPIDALSVSMGEKGVIDIDYMSSLLDEYSNEQIINELENGKYIYKSGEIYVTRDEFLSGDVKTKFENETNIEYKKDLQEVIPKDINPYDIEVEFGASWIDSKYIEEFVNKINDHQGASAYYTKYNSQWTVNFNASYTASKTYGTERYSFEKVVQSAINSKKIQIYDTIDEERIFNKQETLLANSKAQLVKKEFSEWIFEDKDRREYLAKKYNSIFNRFAERKYNGEVLPFHGKVSDDIIKLRPHQKNAAYRMSLKSKILLDHTVGTGKTFTLIAGLSELKRMGKINKPLVVVPNHKVSDWAKDWVTLYPNATILAPDEKDFLKENRQKLFSRMITSDYDGIIIGHSQLVKLQNDPNFEANLISDEIAKIQESIELMRAEEGKPTRSIKNAEKKIESLEAKFEALQRKDQDTFITFADLGIDYLAVDESHEFKNLPYTSSLMNVGGMGSPTGSQKAFDLYIKVRYIEDVLEKPNIAFLTGTPISNSIAELYLLQKFLSEKELEKQGLYSFDAWVKQYAKVETTWQLSATGSYKAKDVLSTFQNLPELMQSYRNFADIITNDQIQEILKQHGEELPLPKMIGNKPKNIIIEKSFAQEEYIGIEDPVTKEYPIGTLIYRSENLPTKPTKGADNMLVIMDNAKKCALDMRILDPSYTDEDDATKTKAMIKEAMEQYKKYELFKGTQLIFCDLSTPKRETATLEKEILILENKINNADDVNIKEKLQEELETIKQEKTNVQINNFSVYTDIKEKLLQNGVPPKEIAFIHHYDTEDTKKKLYNDVNAGKIRFLLGSTKKMGAGTNVQERLVGLHNLDAPWKPSDLEQREGRIIRQGNLIYNLYKALETNNKEEIDAVLYKLQVNETDAKDFLKNNEEFRVMVNRYATKGTLDSRMWEILEQKSKFIEKLKQPSSTTERKVTDTQLESMSAGEMKALASDNPLILRNLQLTRKVDDLSELKKAHKKSLIHIESQINRFEYYVNNKDMLLDGLKKDLLTVEEIKKNKTTMRINGFNHNVKHSTTELGETIMNNVRMFMKQAVKNKSLGTFGNFDLELNKYTEHGFSSFVNIELIGEHEEPYAITISALEQSGQGLVTKINNMLNIPSAKYDRTVNDINEAIYYLPELRASIKPFDNEEELVTAQKKLEIIRKELTKPKNEQNMNLFEEDNRSKESKEKPIDPIDKEKTSLHDKLKAFREKIPLSNPQIKKKVIF
jgi:N12 class adenine-specific DNA methylase/methylase of polypeptide subunit release factors